MKKNTFFNQLQKWHFFCRIVAIATMVQFVLPFVSWAFDPSIYQAGANELLFANKIISIPEKLGQTASVIKGKDKLVVHIQDLHCHYEAQENIARILKHLKDKYDLKIVGIEGATQLINTTHLSAYPDQTVKEDVGRHFMQQGKLSGAEFYSSLYPGNVRLQGIEDHTLYQDSRSKVGEFLSDESLGMIHDLQDAFFELKTRIYTKELQQFDSLRQRFQQNQLSLLKYVVSLMEYAKQQKVQLNSFNQIVRYGSRRQNILPQHVEYDALLQQIEQLDQRIRQTLYTKPEQVQLDQFVQRLETSEKLINISVTAEELETFRLNHDLFDVKHYTRFIERFDPNSDLAPDIEVYKLNSFLDQVYRFYEMADKRSDVFVEKTLTGMKDQNTDIAVMITGGFHTEKVLQALKNKSVSVLSIRPNIEHDDLVNPYFSLMRNRKTPLEKLLEQNQDIIALAPGFPQSVDANVVLTRAEEQAQDQDVRTFLKMIRLALQEAQLARLVSGELKNVEAIRQVLRAKLADYPYSQTMQLDWEKAVYQNNRMIIPVKNLEHSLVIQPVGSRHEANAKALGRLTLEQRNYEALVMENSVVQSLETQILGATQTVRSGNLLANAFKTIWRFTGLGNITLSSVMSIASIGLVSAALITILATGTVTILPVAIGVSGLVLAGIVFLGNLSKLRLISTITVAVLFSGITLFTMMQPRVDFTTQERAAIAAGKYQELSDQALSKVMIGRSGVSTVAFAFVGEKVRGNGLFWLIDQYRDYYRFYTGSDKLEVYASTDQLNAVELGILPEPAAYHHSWGYEVVQCIDRLLGKKHAQQKQLTIHWPNYDDYFSMKKGGKGVADSRRFLEWHTDNALNPQITEEELQLLDRASEANVKILMETTIGWRSEKLLEETLRSHEKYMLNLIRHVKDLRNAWLARHPDKTAADAPIGINMNPWHLAKDVYGAQIDQWIVEGKSTQEIRSLLLTRLMVFYKESRGMVSRFYFGNSNVKDMSLPIALQRGRVLSEEGLIPELELFRLVMKDNPEIVNHTTLEVSPQAAINSIQSNEALAERRSANMGTVLIAAGSALVVAGVTLAVTIGVTGLALLLSALGLAGIAGTVITRRIRTKNSYPKTDEEGPLTEIDKEILSSIFQKGGISLSVTMIFHNIRNTVLTGIIKGIMPLFIRSYMFVVSRFMGVKQAEVYDDGYQPDVAIPLARKGKIKIQTIHSAAWNETVDQLYPLLNRKFEKNEQARMIFHTELLDALLTDFAKQESISASHEDVLMAVAERAKENNIELLIEPVFELTVGRSLDTFQQSVKDIQSWRQAWAVKHPDDAKRVQLLFDAWHWIGEAFPELYKQYFAAKTNTERDQIRSEALSHVIAAYDSMKDDLGWIHITNVNPRIKSEMLTHGASVFGNDTLIPNRAYLRHVQKTRPDLLKKVTFELGPMYFLRALFGHEAKMRRTGKSHRSGSGGFTNLSVLGLISGISFTAIGLWLFVTAGFSLAAIATVGVGIALAIAIPAWTARQKQQSQSFQTLRADKVLKLDATIPAVRTNVSKPSKDQLKVEKTITDKDAKLLHKMFNRGSVSTTILYPLLFMPKYIRAGIAALMRPFFRIYMLLAKIMFGITRAEVFADVVQIDQALAAFEKGKLPMRSMHAQSDPFNSEITYQLIKRQWTAEKPGRIVVHTSAVQELLRDVRKWEKLSSIEDAMDLVLQLADQNNVRLMIEPQNYDNYVHNRPFNADEEIAFLKKWRDRFQKNTGRAPPVFMLFDAWHWIHEQRHDLYEAFHNAKTLDEIASIRAEIFEEITTTFDKYVDMIDWLHLSNTKNMKWLPTIADHGNAMFGQDLILPLMDFIRYVDARRPDLLDKATLEFNPFYWLRSLFGFERKARLAGKYGVKAKSVQKERTGTKRGFVTVETLVTLAGVSLGAYGLLLAFTSPAIVMGLGLLIIGSLLAFSATDKLSDLRMVFAPENRPFLLRIVTILGLAAAIVFLSSCATVGKTLKPNQIKVPQKIEQKQVDQERQHFTEPVKENGATLRADSTSYRISGLAGHNKSYGAVILSDNKAIEIDFNKQNATLQLDVKQASHSWFVLLHNPKLPNGFVRLQRDTKATGLQLYHLNKIGFSGVQRVRIEVGVSSHPANIDSTVQLILNRSGTKLAIADKSKQVRLKTTSDVKVHESLSVGGIKSIEQAKLIKANVASHVWQEGRKLIPHVVLWYGDKPLSKGEINNGQYGWFAFGHNPLIRPGDFASAHQPLLGPFDSGDPAYLKWMVGTAKAIGMNGFSIDYYAEERAYEKKTLPNIFKAAEEAGDFTLSMMYETRLAKGDARVMKKHLKYILDNYATSPAYQRIAGVPVLYVFGLVSTGMNPAAYEKVMQELEDEGYVFILIGDTVRHPTYYGVSSGMFEWINMGAFLFDKKLAANPGLWEEQAHGWINQAVDSNPQLFNVGSVYTEFDDRKLGGGNWGAGQPRVLPAGGGDRFKGGSTLHATLDYLLANKGKIPWAKIMTWDDWNEGTEFEPSYEKGFSHYFELMELAAKFRGVKSDPNQMIELTRAYLEAKYKGSIPPKALEVLEQAKQYVPTMNKKIEAGLIYYKEQTAKSHPFKALWGYLSAGVTGLSGFAGFMIANVSYQWAATQFPNSVAFGFVVLPVLLVSGWLAAGAIRFINIGWAVHQAMYQSLKNNEHKQTDQAKLAFGTRVNLFFRSLTMAIAWSDEMKRLNLPEQTQKIMADAMDYLKNKQAGIYNQIQYHESFNHHRWAIFNEFQGLVALLPGMSKLFHKDFDKHIPERRQSTDVEGKGSRSKVAAELERMKQILPKTLNAPLRGMRSLPSRIVQYGLRSMLFASDRSQAGNIRLSAPIRALSTVIIIGLALLQGVVAAFSGVASSSKAIDDLSPRFQAIKQQLTVPDAAAARKFNVKQIRFKALSEKGNFFLRFIRGQLLGAYDENGDAANHETEATIFIPDALLQTMASEMPNSIVDRLRYRVNAFLFGVIVSYQSEKYYSDSRFDSLTTAMGLQQLEVALPEANPGSLENLKGGEQGSKWFSRSHEKLGLHATELTTLLGTYLSEANQVMDQKSDSAQQIVQQALQNELARGAAPTLATVLSVVEQLDQTQSPLAKQLQILSQESKGLSIEKQEMIANGLIGQLISGTVDVGTAGRTINQIAGDQTQAVFIMGMPQTYQAQLTQIQSVLAALKSTSQWSAEARGLINRLTLLEQALQAVSNQAAGQLTMIDQNIGLALKAELMRMSRYQEAGMLTIGEDLSRNIHGVVTGNIEAKAVDGVMMASAQVYEVSVSAKQLLTLEQATAKELPKGTLAKAYRGEREQVQQAPRASNRIMGSVVLALMTVINIRSMHQLAMRLDPMGYLNIVVRGIGPTSNMKALLQDTASPVVQSYLKFAVNPQNRRTQRNFVKSMLRVMKAEAKAVERGQLTSSEHILTVASFSELAGRMKAMTSTQMGIWEKMPQGVKAKTIQVPGVLLKLGGKGALGAYYDILDKLPAKVDRNKLEKQRRKLFRSASVAA